MRRKWHGRFMCGCTVHVRNNETERLCIARGNVPIIDQLEESLSAKNTTNIVSIVSQ